MGYIKPVINISTVITAHYPTLTQHSTPHAKHLGATNKLDKTGSFPGREQKQQKHVFGLLHC